MLPQQHLMGFYPLQTEDVKIAVLAMRDHRWCNGKVGAVGGSAGASHAAHNCQLPPGDDGRLDCAVCLSGAYAFDDPVSLGDRRRSNFKHDVENYVGSDDLSKLHEASPIAI